MAARQLADAAPGAAGSYPTNLTVLGSNLFFCAYTEGTGWELWIAGPGGVRLAADINPGSANSRPDPIFAFNGAVYFGAYDSRRGGELWKSDGVTAVRVADINPDSNDNIKPIPRSSWPAEFAAYSGELFFRADDAAVSTNYELWKYDGVAASRVANIHPDTGADHSSYPVGLTAWNGALFFMANDGSSGYELWKHSPAGTVLLSDINPGGAASSSYPKDFVPFGDRLYFQAYRADSGYELWRTDGITATRVTDLNTGAESSYPKWLTVFNNALLFSARDGVHGEELWRFDGTNAQRVSDINPFGDAAPKNLTLYQDKLYFAADDGTHGWELWEHDGSSVRMVADLNAAGSSYPEHLAVYNGLLFFVATTPDTGYELFKCDGRTITLAADMNPGPGSSFPRDLRATPHTLYFSAASDGFTNFELWGLTMSELVITRLEHVGADVRLFWNSAGGTTNVVEAAPAAAGPFTAVSGQIVIPPGQTGASFTEEGAGTAALRFYRVLGL